MTACTNKARGAVVAALAGVLALGAVPAVALATGSDVSLQWVQPTGAFEGGHVTAGFNGSVTDYDSSAKTPASKTYDGQPVALDWVYVTMIGGADGGDDFRVDFHKNPADVCDVEYFTRDDNGNPNYDEPVTDPVEVGKYAAVVTVIDGGVYDGATVTIPFDINARQIQAVDVVNDTLTYDATTHNDEFKFKFQDENGNWFDVTEGRDFEVYYVLEGHGTAEKDAVDVKDADKYVAVVTGINGWEGVHKLSDVITVNELDLATAEIEGLASNSAEDEIQNIMAIVINGHRFTGDDAIMGELQAHIDTEESNGAGYAGNNWFDNGKYRYTVSEVGDNPNIENAQDFDAYKVSYLAEFSYDDAAWPTEMVETFLNDADSLWSSNKVTAHAQNGVKGGVDLSFADGDIVKYKVYDESGNVVAANFDWGHTPGTYTVVYHVDDATMATDGYVYGGQAVATVRVFEEAVDADASAAVIYGGKVVTSVNTVYTDGKDVKDDIKVVVKTEDGVEHTEGDGVFTVTYYDSEGRVVNGPLTDAGTYTLKASSSDYKLTGTTEMTVTIAPRDLTSTVVSSLFTHKWDDAGNVTEYLPWREKVGYTIDGLGLEYLKPNGDADKDTDWIALPMADVKVTILDASGEQIDRIDDEGVYTIHFEARNAKAANNYVIPGDITVTCIKDGHNGEHANHLKFRDVAYTDYFANAVDKVSNKKFMTGYKGTKLFGSYDNLNRGQMAIVLYNMAKADGKMSENGLQYTELGGYITGFDDVDGNEYYAKAIAWARLAGVVNGYDETHFGPEDTITREQFAAMLMNYEKKFGDYEQADASVLDDFDDASGVSSWATNAVAWGVENGILGNGGFLGAQSDIIRADAACMVYNYTK